MRELADTPHTCIVAAVCDHTLEQHAMKAAEIIGPFQYLVLRAIRDLGNEVTANEISLRVESRHRERYNPGQLYSTAKRMAERQLLRTHDESEIIFTITEKGLRAIDDFEKFMREILAP